MTSKRQYTERKKNENRFIILIGAKILIPIGISILRSKEE